nr:MAG TPA_asm: hypothetical protein [Caudoviricetes sp.]
MLLCRRRTTALIATCHDNHGITADFLAIPGN